MKINAPINIKELDDMKNSFKRAGTILFSLLLTLSMASCGVNRQENSGSESGTDNSAGLSAEKGKKLTFMLPAHNYDDMEKWQNVALHAFKEKYTDITVEFVSASIENWMTKLLSSAASGEPIDVFQDGANNNPMYALQGINQPLQAYIDMENPNLHKKTMDAVFKYNGNYHVAVAQPSVCVIYYNKDIFENEGIDDPMELYNSGKWDFNNLTRIAKQLTVNNSTGQRWGLACNYPYIFFGANATSMVKLDDTYKYKLNITDSNLAYSLGVIQDAWYTSKWQGWKDNPWSTFYNGSAAMLADFQWVEANILQAKEMGMVDFEYGVVPMASGPNNPDGLAPMTAFGYAMGKGSDAPYHAGLLIDAMINAEAANNNKNNEKIPQEHQEIYASLAEKPFCINSYDSAVGGAFEICQAIGVGQSIAQAVAEYTPIYQQKINQANSAIDFGKITSDTEK